MRNEEISSKVENCSWCIFALAFTYTPIIRRNVIFYHIFFLISWSILLWMVPKKSSWWGGKHFFLSWLVGDNFRNGQFCLYRILKRRSCFIFRPCSLPSHLRHVGVYLPSSRCRCRENIFVDENQFVKLAIG